LKALHWLGFCIRYGSYIGRGSYYEDAYPELYRKNIFPALILFVIVSGALLAQFLFKSPKIAAYIVLSPAIIFVLALVGMMITSMFIRDWK
jgi:hypothetical protein